MKTRYVRRVARVEVLDRCVVFKFKHPVRVRMDEKVRVRVKGA